MAWETCIAPRICSSVGPSHSRCSARVGRRRRRGRLLAEARAASTLNHPNIAVVYEASEVERGSERLGYIAMEFVEGTTVAALLSNGPLGVERALDITEQMAGALQEAHAQGIVHRDLKPSNVMVTAGGRVKVLDFGVAQRREPLAAPSDETRTSELRDGLTGFVGTLPYAAPEQATGREVDGRADIFSLGVMLYELLNGTPPFGGRNAAQMLEAILRDDVPPFSRAESDPRLPPLERLVRRMLARDPDRRVANVVEVRDALVAIQSGDPMAAADPPRPVTAFSSGHSPISPAAPRTTGWEPASARP